MKYEIGTTLTGGHGRFTLTDCEVIGIRESDGEETWLYTWSTDDDRRVLTTGRELNAAIADGAVLEQP
tara:strand:- start:342 stop:545 length:204 start_codon:yes stop_codon:yes gene_type:complete